MSTVVRHSSVCVRTRSWPSAVYTCVWYKHNKEIGDWHNLCNTVGVCQSSRVSYIYYKLIKKKKILRMILIFMPLQNVFMEQVHTPIIDEVLCMQNADTCFSKWCMVFSRSTLNHPGKTKNKNVWAVWILSANQHGNQKRMSEGIPLLM